MKSESPWKIDIDMLDFISLECHKSSVNLKDSGLFQEDKSAVLITLLNEGKYLEIFKLTACKNLIQCLQENANKALLSDSDDLVSNLFNDDWLNSYFQSFSNYAEFLCVPIAYLRLFLQANWIGPSPNSDQINEITQWVKVQFSPPTNGLIDGLKSFLIADGETISHNAKFPELLVAAQFLFKLDKFYCPFQEWWYLRSVMLQQWILEERSEKLHNVLLNSSKSLLSSIETLYPNFHKVLCMELYQYHLNLYSEIGTAKQYLLSCEEQFNIDVKLMGALGKRTKYQKQELAQLFLEVNNSEDESCADPFKDDFTAASNLPKDIALNDDVRLNEINFTDEAVKWFPKLTPLQQAVILSRFNYLKKSQPKDDFESEELSPFLSCVLSQPQCWVLQRVALVYRSRLENGQPKALERSLSQLESLVNDFSSIQPNVSERVDMFFYTHLPPIWDVEAHLAEILVSVGAIQSALDVYLRIQYWEQIVACYNHLNLRHKAAEVLKVELEKKETPKLYCLLGDATDDVECYRIAWELSGKRSARAQRHWGMYLFNRKQYEESISHFETSLAINSLQPEIWSRLGFAALDTCKWELCASAYRRFCVLQPDSFEAWNNLAKAYVKRGEKPRALSALQEAVKCNYENWRVWDNLLVVSTDCADFETVILCYHRLLDLKEKHVDTEVLECLVKAICKNLQDFNGKPSKTHLKSSLKLFGRITSLVQNNAKIWQLYAELTAQTPEPTQETFDKIAQYLQRSHKAAVQDFNWFKSVSASNDVLKICLSLGNSYKICCDKNADPVQKQNMLSSAKLSINSVVSKIKQQHSDLVGDNIIPELQENYSKLCEELHFFEEQLHNLKNKTSS